MAQRASVESRINNYKKLLINSGVFTDEEVLDKAERNHRRLLLMDRLDDTEKRLEEELEKRYFFGRPKRSWELILRLDRDAEKIHVSLMNRL